MTEKSYFEKINNMIKRGDIILCDLGSGKGSEQYGIRPCVVVQNDLGNRFSPTLIVAPTTSKLEKIKLPTHVKIEQCDSLDKNSVVLCEQLRTIDKVRISGICGKVSSEDLKRITAALITSVEIFKRGEQQAREQAIRVKTRERSIIELVELVGLEPMMEYICRYQRELIKLDGICNKHGLLINNYYNQDEGIKEILEKNVDL